MSQAMTPDRADVKVVQYAFVLGGVTALIFGLILLFRQEAALSILMLMLGLWWLIQGAFTLFAVFIDRTDMGWKLFMGLLGLTAGVVVLFNPGEAADIFKGGIGVFLGVIGGLAGLTSLVGGVRSKQAAPVVFGVFSILIAILILANAQFSTTVLVTFFGILLVIEGVTSIVVGLRG